jgi:crotonobetainyl-CoA:carnitine CoA-transferase CaiB-like acyl-CoA transferase
MNRVLHGLTVVEFASNLAAAYATMMLADQGAQAIKVEFPGVPAFPRHPVFDRGKRRLMLDPRAGAGSDQMKRVLARADIVVFGGGPARRLASGLDYESIRKINPHSIVLYTPAFGSRGAIADLEGGELSVQAVSGIAASQWARSGNPVATIFPVTGYATALLGAIGVVTALIARDRGAGGQAVEVPMIAGGLALQTGAALRHPQLRPLHPIGGSVEPLGPIPCYRLFEAADGQYLFVACGTPAFWSRFAIAIDRPDLITDPRFEDAPWGISSKNRAALSAILEPILRSRPRDEWLRILHDIDVPAAPVTTRADFFDSPQVRYLDMCAQVADPVVGGSVQMGVPVRLSETPGLPGYPAASGWECTEDLLAELSPVAGAPVCAFSGLPPLAGIRVLDFSSYIAGSFCGMLLAQLGADVIKVESLAGDSFRSMEFAFMGWNQGKRSLALDLTTAEGRELARNLAREADIVLENMRPGRMARFGLDYESLAGLNRRLIYISISGYGARGPDYIEPGFDPLLQARSGMMAAQGGHEGHPVYLTCSPCDYGAAMLGTFASVLAIRARLRSGRGQLCETSLLQAAIAFQAGEMVFYNDRPDLEAGSPEYRGPSALKRFYQCAGDEWICLEIENSAAWGRLRTSLGLEEMQYETARRERPEGRLATKLKKFFGERSRAEIVAMMAAAGVGIVPVNRLVEIFDDTQMASNALFTALDHPGRGSVTQCGLLIHFSATPGVLNRPAPVLGEHSTEVLCELAHIDRAAVEDLAARRVVRAKTFTSAGA